VTIVRFLSSILNLLQPYRFSLVQVCVLADFVHPLTRDSSGFAVVMAEAPDTAAIQQNNIAPSA